MSPAGRRMACQPGPNGPHYGDCVPYWRAWQGMRVVLAAVGTPRVGIPPR